MGLVDIDVMMAIIFFVIGCVFYLSKGKAVIFLSGYNTLPKERKKIKNMKK